MPDYTQTLLAKQHAPALTDDAPAVLAIANIVRAHARSTGLRSAVDLVEAGVALALSASGREGFAELLEPKELIAVTLLLNGEIASDVLALER